MENVTENAQVSGTAWVFGTALVSGNARVSGTAQVSGTAWVSGNARVSGNAQVDRQSDIAWVDRVGTGQSMTLHRTVTGWRINAGCVTFDAPTVAGVCALVRARISKKVPEWGGIDAETVKRYRAQVRAALTYLASMVEE
jgi:hypothetical protein